MMESLICRLSSFCFSCSALSAFLFSLMTDTHDTNLPDKPVELEEDKKTAEVSEPATTETPA